MGTGGYLLRKARARLSNAPTGFVWIENGRLAGSGYPISRGQLKWLIGRGITAVLTLTPEPLPQKETSGLPLELLHLPMQDHEKPKIETLGRGAELVRGSLGAGRNLVVHCLAGEGRTGCVLAAYLMTERKMTAEDALRALRKIKPLFVERQQEQALRDFQASMSA